ncbi:hypothetical protein K7I13_00780 [Brucepastera parasyntrophica]|uniref:hypothetical protein n=1 Tax=Brucepastera parasyntrophica TaxID=2880008 RepID=UPI00210BF2D4|nr:hypothetical protein [Brucepastera parasyntrophica]ULQ59915.1 hypothetical protein K7I13_00780 [Brucepastera parasyntrophica]
MKVLLVNDTQLVKMKREIVFAVLILAFFIIASSSGSKNTVLVLSLVLLIGIFLFSFLFKKKIEVDLSAKTLLVYSLFGNIEKKIPLMQIRKIIITDKDRLNSFGKNNYNTEIISFYDINDEPLFTYRTRDIHIEALEEIKKIDDKITFEYIQDDRI